MFSFSFGSASKAFSGKFCKGKRYFRNPQIFNKILTFL